LGLAFRKWKHKQLKWIKERKVNEILMEKNRKRRQRARYFSLWQQLFKKEEQRRDTQREAAIHIGELVTRQQAKNKRVAFNSWYRFAILRSLRNLYMKWLVLRFINKNKEEGFHRWLLVTRESGYKAQIDELIEKTGEK